MGFESHAHQFPIVIGSVFCQKFAQIGASCYLERFNTFDDILTKLCEQLEMHVNMTSLKRGFPRVNIGHMFKKRTC